MALEFKPSAHTKWLNDHAKMAHKAMLENPSFASANHSFDVSKRFLEQYFLEVREWIATKDLPPMKEPG